ncbi:Uncharacterized protein RNJ44_04848 [Nakaseomyces bracarensis]|uniref:Uncharacterized protein n=1 Tax=Nakaseomyces bracarensis TaxID=273131 RepID=A0ABR4NW23_9SACH
MSRASKITFSVCSILTVSTVIGVHYVQAMERDTLHQGPIKDAQRVAEKKRKLMPAATDEKKLLNRNEHDIQQELRRKYEAVQPLSGEVVTKDGERIEK